MGGNSKTLGNFSPRTRQHTLFVVFHFLKKCFPKTVRSFIHGNREQNPSILEIELQHSHPSIESMLVIIYFILR